MAGKKDKSVIVHARKHIKIMGFKIFLLWKVCVFILKHTSEVQYSKEHLEN